MHAMRSALAALPFIDAPVRHRFDPVELQRDVVRLRRFYRESGFLQPDIDYNVRVNKAGSEVAVRFVIKEGPPVLLREMHVVGGDGVSSPDIPDSLLEPWAALHRELATRRGRRFGASEARDIASAVLTFLKDRGFREAVVRSVVAVDSTAHQTDLTLFVQPGPRRRVGIITVDGNVSVGDRVVTRALPFQTGDWLSASSLARGRREIQQVSLFRQVTLTTPRDVAADSAVPVHIRVAEARPRLSRAEVGYVSEGAGFTGRGQWTHPNFTGGARSLTASVELQTGAGSVDARGEKLIRSSLTLTQPYVFVPRLMANVGPFVEFRDDYRDRSVALGLTASLVYRLGDLSSVALQYRYSGRDVKEYRFGDVTAASRELQTALGLDAAVLDSLGDDADESTLTLSATLGSVDNVVNPRRGVLVRPAVTVTVPTALSTTSFTRLDLSAARFQPLGRETVLVARVSWGRLFPFGKSVPAPGEDPTFAFLYLRDQSMTAGGTSDVRGWGSRLLGPKLPDVETTVEGTDTVAVADHYAPIGALARLTGSLELRFPAPGLSPVWGAHVFLDGGRVWTPDERFSQSPFLPAETDFRVAAGAGLSYQTPVGALRLSLACKLNPSELDLRDPGEVLSAVLTGSPLSDVPTSWRRRLHLHLEIGLAL
jgi:outer membrane protein insertion porin family